VGERVREKWRGKNRIEEGIGKVPKRQSNVIGYPN
jgi:hypothetical protein